MDLFDDKDQNKATDVRPVDQLAEETYSWWKKTFVFMKKTEVKTWKGIFAIAFIGGALTALIWAISFEVGPFSSAAPKYTGTADLSWDANTESDLAGYNIYYGTNSRTGDDPNSCVLCGYADKISVGADTTDYSFSELINSQVYYFSVTAFDDSGNESAFSTEVHKTTQADTTPPIRSAGAPSVAPTVATLDAGTTQTVISLSTDEDATCKYSTTAGTAYASMVNTFTETGEVDHLTSVSSLSNGQTYHYYVRCQDGSIGHNANTDDYQITFSVAAGSDTIAPVRSDGLPTGELTVGTASTTLSLSTNENATCKYGTTGGTAYNSIANTFSTTGSTTHSASISGLSNGQTYHYYVRCRDVATSPNTNADDYVITFSIGADVIVSDNTPPLRSGGTPSGSLDSGTTQTDIALTTSEDATCKYSTTSGVAYASMTNTFTDDGDDHTATITGLSNGRTYHYYVRCQDDATPPNVNTDDYEITFAVSNATDSVPPVRSNGYPNGGLSSGTSSTTLSLSTNENATCKYGTTSNVAYDSIANTFTTTETTEHSATISGLSDNNSYNYYVRCKDGKDNANSDDYVISFSVDKTGSTTVTTTSSNNDNNKDKDKSSSSKKKKTTLRGIKTSPTTVSRGKVLVQSGKKLSKSSNIALYFSRPGGGYYPPQIVKTNGSGSFSVVYKANKAPGKYGWYAVDLKSGWKSKTSVYRIK
jgi:hypothetical protein